MSSILKPDFQYLNLFHGFGEWAKINKSINIFNQSNKYFPKLILLKNHGIICLGSTAEECLVATEICEKAAEIFLGSKLSGSINFLIESDQSKLEKDPNEIYRKGLLT